MRTRDLQWSEAKLKRSSAGCQGSVIEERCVIELLPIRERSDMLAEDVEAERHRE